MSKLALAVAAVAALAVPATADSKETWTPAKDAKWLPISPLGDKGPQISIVFGTVDLKGGKPSGSPVGFFLKTPAGFKAGAHTHTSDDYAVIISGSMHNYAAPGTDEGPGLTSGGSWYQPAKAAHDNHCDDSSKDGCLVFVVMSKGFDFKPWVDPKAPKKDEPKKDAPKPKK